MYNINFFLHYSLRKTKDPSLSGRHKPLTKVQLLKRLGIQFLNLFYSNGKYFHQSQENIIGWISHIPKLKPITLIDREGA